MSKLTKWIWTTVLLLVLFLTGTIFADKQYLHENIIRLRVVGASNSDEDQEIKLKVRDAVTTYLEARMETVEDISQARQYISAHIPELTEIANGVLCASGSQNLASVYLTEENADRREYATFRLPSGVYETLRVDIGAAEGNNWWCVVFPSLCLPSTEDGFQTAAVSAGFDSDLTQTLTGTSDYQIRFFLLDCIGKLENFFSFH